MTQVFARLLRDDLGQDLIEYGLLAALISVLAVATITSLGNALLNSYQKIEAGIP